MRSTPDPDRLRAALDQIANALQPGAVAAARLREAAVAVAEHAATIDEGLKRVVTILQSLQGDARERPGQ